MNNYFKNGKYSAELSEKIRQENKKHPPKPKKKISWEQRWANIKKDYQNGNFATS